MSSNVSIAKKIIKQTATHVLAGETVSTRSGMVKNNRDSFQVEYSNVVILLSVGLVFFFSFSFSLSFSFKYCFFFECM